jgi:CHASE3 domain sensor protein
MRHKISNNIKLLLTFVAVLLLPVTLILILFYATYQVIDAFTSNE